MNKFELKQILDKENFNPRVYDLEGGLIDDRLCLFCNAVGSGVCIFLNAAKSTTRSGF